MRALLLGLAALLLALAGAADARMHAPYRGHRIVPIASAPLDGFTTPAAAYSFRKLRSAYSGPAVKLRRATGGTQDINFLGATGFTGAPIDIAAANVFCTATNCFIDTWYDQSGNGRHAAQTTPGDQPAFIFNCNGSLPCGRVTAAPQRLNGPTAAWAGRTTLSVVGQRSAGTADRCYLISKGGTAFGPSTSAGWWVVTDFVTEFHALGVTEGVWHAALAVVDGSSSLTRIDGAEAAGANVAGVTTGAIAVAYNGAGLTCNMSEAVIWDNYVLTLPERTAFQANQKSFFSTP